MDKFSDIIDPQKFTDFAKENFDVWNELVEAEVHHPHFGAGRIKKIEQREGNQPLIYVNFTDSIESMCFNHESFSGGAFTSIALPRQLIDSQNKWRAYKTKNPIHHRYDARMWQKAGHQTVSMSKHSPSGSVSAQKARQILAQHDLEILADLSLDQQLALEKLIDARASQSGFAIGIMGEPAVRVKFPELFQTPLLERNAVELLNGIRQIASTQFQRSFRVHEIPGYGQILHLVRDYLGIRSKASASINSRELEIVTAVFESAWTRLSDEKRKNIERELLNSESLDSLAKDKIKVMGLIGALTTAQLSGFGIYLFATSSLGAITGVLGATLPFAAYTGLTSLISVAIGPVGWIAAIAYAIKKLDKPAYKTLVSLVLFLASAKAEKGLGNPPNK